MQKYKKKLSAYKRNGLLFLAVLIFLYLGVFFFNFYSFSAIFCFGAIIVCIHKICQPLVVTIPPKRYNIRNIIIKGKSKEIVIQPEGDQFVVLLVTILYARKNQLGLQYARKIDGGAYKYEWASVGDHLHEKERQICAFDKLKLTAAQAQRFYSLVSNNDTDGTFNANYLYNVLVNIRAKTSNSYFFRLVEKIYFDVFLYQLGLKVATHSSSPTTEEREIQAKTPIVPYGIEKRVNQSPITEDDADKEPYLTKRVMDDEPTKTIVKKRPTPVRKTRAAKTSLTPSTALLLFVSPTIDASINGFLVGILFAILGVFWMLNRLAKPPEKTQETAAKAAHKKALLDAMLEAELNGNKERADYLNDVLLNY